MHRIAKVVNVDDPHYDADDRYRLQPGRPEEREAHVVIFSDILPLSHLG